MSVKFMFSLNISISSNDLKCVLWFKKFGSSLFGAYIFCRVIILSLVLMSTVMNLPSGSEKYFSMLKEKLLLNKTETPALELEWLLNKPLKPYSANPSFSVSFELCTSCKK